MTSGYGMRAVAMMLALATLPAVAREADGGVPQSNAVEASAVSSKEQKVRLMVMREVNSSKAKAGDIVKLMVDESFEHDGMMIPVGTSAFGVVREAKDGGAALQRGSLEVRLTHIAFQGREIALGGDILDKGEGGKADDAAKVLLAPIYILFARGNVAKLRAGEIVYGELLAQPSAI